MLLEPVLQFLCEFFLQLVLEVLAELGVRSARDTSRRSALWPPVLAAIGYALLGALAGGASLGVLPELALPAGLPRVVNLVLTPILAGGLMAALGAWRRRREQALIGLDRFWCGFLFAFAMALVRLAWGR